MVVVKGAGDKVLAFDVVKEPPGVQFVRVIVLKGDVGVGQNLL